MAANILDLPAEIMQKIFLFIDHRQIFQLRKVCGKFQSICSCPSVWRRVRFNSPTPLSFLFSSLHLMKNVTTDLFIKGYRRDNTGEREYAEKENLSVAFLEKLAAVCPGLKSLSLDDCYIDGNKVDISHLPNTLEKLSLAGSHVLNPHKFNKIGNNNLIDRFPHLREVDLSRSRCFWSLFHHPSGFWLWDTGVKKVVIQGYVNQTMIGFPTAAQRSRVESLDITDLTGFSMFYLSVTMRNDANSETVISLTGRNMPQLREVCIRCTNPGSEIYMFSDENLYDLFGGKFEDNHELPLKKLETLDLRGTAVTCEGILKMRDHFPALRMLRLEGSGVRSGDLAALKAAMPNCQLDL